MGSLVGLITLLALVAADSGSPRPLRDHVDRIELNHVLNTTTGEVQLDQVIFWDYSPTHGYVVRAWRTHRCFSQTPYRVTPRLVRARWHDSRDGDASREVTAGSFIETWTDFDPETANQAVIDRNSRRELISAPASRLKRGNR